MTTELTHLIRRKKRVYNRAKCYKHNSDWSEYKDLQRKVRHMLKHNHRAYITSIISSSNTNKLFWKYMKVKKQDNSGIPILHGPNGEVITESTYKAYVLSENFRSVFTSEK